MIVIARLEGLSANDAYALLNALNAVHSNLTFTCEFQSNGCLHFIDVPVNRNGEGVATTAAYRKPTWIFGDYILLHVFSNLSFQSVASFTDLFILFSMH